MSATAAAANPLINAAAAVPSRPAAAPSPSDEDRFDRHLDAARQPRDEAQAQPAADDASRTPAPARPAVAKPAEKPAGSAAKPDQDAHPDDAALAAAMLALIGQAAAPAKTLALAATAAHGAAKAIAGAKGNPAGAGALASLSANAAATPAGPALPALASGGVSGLPMLAKPAASKELPLDAAQLANLTASAPSAPASAPLGTSHALSIASPAGTPAFAQELGQQVVWLGQQDIKQARIRLHPEDLGTLDVKVSMNHERVDVSFAVQHPAAVHLVQQTLPQLDALLAHHGLALGQTDVGQRQQPGGSSRGAGDDTDTIGGVDAAEPAALASTPVSALGLLDTFA